MSDRTKITLDQLQHGKQAGRKFSVLTCYDYATARAMETAGVEVLLVGDSAGEVMLGLPDTRQTPPEILLALTAAVRRGAPQAYVMADLPLACRQDGHRDQVMSWARRFIHETGADALKIEVTGDDDQLVRALAEEGLPIVAHLGLLPQHVDPQSGYKAKGKSADDARLLLAEAERFERAGAAMLLLEAVAGDVARIITERAGCPVIGCVAGPHCDGTVVVLHDMIGWGGGHPPRKVKRYADLSAVMTEAFAQYVQDIHTGQFPREQDAIRMNAGELEKFLAAEKTN